MLNYWGVFFQTLKHLKWIQIYYQLHYKIKKYSPSKAVNIHRATWKKSWLAPGIMPSLFSDEGEFSTMGERGRIFDSQIWNSNQHSRLWLYHLHYFDECQSAIAYERASLIHNYITLWVRYNPPDELGLGWEPYPISLRIVNWIKWFSTPGVEVVADWLQSLAQQADVLFHRLEYHILGNHLLANAKALIFVGTFFSGSAAEDWLHKGLSILDREINEQFLADGGHFELSPMYHAYLILDICDLCYLSEVTTHVVLQQRLAQWQSVIQRGLGWLSAMTHPDGEIAFFNDAALERAPRLADLLAYADSLGLNFEAKCLGDYYVKHLQDTGYGVVALPNQGKAILDLAEVGARYQPGHAHADTLSFELSLYGQRLLVNSGTSHYVENAERGFQRSTAAHNTVCIDEQNSSQVWKSFRVGRRAHPVGLQIQQAGDEIRLLCAQDGYSRRLKRLMHHREWRFKPGKVIIIDQIQGKFKQALAYFYLHPEVRVREAHAQQIICELAQDERVTLSWQGAMHLSIEATHWYPRFGEEVSNQVIKVALDSGRLVTEINY
jgi:uncharacterized heparinase superfamily protein